MDINHDALGPGRVPGNGSVDHNPAAKTSKLLSYNQAAESPVERCLLFSWRMSPADENGKAQVGAFITNTQSGVVWKYTADTFIQVTLVHEKIFFWRLLLNVLGVGPVLYVC